MPEIKLEIGGLKEALAGLDAYERTRVARAAIRAMNRGINSARTLMVREISRETGLKSGDVRKALPLSEARDGRLEARLAASLKLMPLAKFRATGPFPSRGRGRGVRWRIGSRTGRDERAFLAQMTSGHRGVFKRVGKGRLPIVELFGPSLGHIFGKYRAQALARAQEIFDTNFDHEIQFETSHA
jgi:hypothetical protein